MSKLLHSEEQLLNDWAIQVHEMFAKSIHGPYQVGSSLVSDKPHRDIDLRTMLEAKDFKKLQKILDVDRLNLAISLWGQKVTGLSPIRKRRSNETIYNLRRGLARSGNRSFLCDAEIIQACI